MSSLQSYYDLQEVMTWVAIKYGERTTEKKVVSSLSRLGFPMKQVCSLMFDHPQEKVGYVAWLTQNTPQLILEDIIKSALNAGYTYVHLAHKKQCRLFFKHISQKSAYKKRKSIARTLLQKTSKIFSPDFLLNEQNVFLNQEAIAHTTQLSRKEVSDLACELSNLNFKI